MADSTAITERMTESKHFRLPDLPDELQVKIYQKYFEGTNLTITRYHQASGNLRFGGIPSLDLELVCYDMHIEARKARSQMTLGTMVVAEGNDFNNGDFAKFVDDNRYSWVRNHIQKLQFWGTRLPTSAPVNWEPLIARCVQLREVDVFIPNRPIVAYLDIADAQGSGSFSPFSGKDSGQRLVRRILARAQPSVRSLSPFGLDSFRTILVQRSAQCKVVAHYGNIYIDMDGRELLADLTEVFYGS
ncbi:hypothetical protein LTR70_007964 [Exophiala xenobiotica]|uniref:Uncharacterized protein n=1 Tax=Lithohypha guttulata TaxID=1690604 RepID=A0ABR0K1R9_9EURO|nr:hypothetical protein LTR24_007810 [Lithohypha guttulata]KAK5312798.1 hypothetical protein LTR70_007964 [Exophiala xenobiotica]